MKPTTRNQLTEAEAIRRLELEEIIMPSLANCLKVGSALREISDRRLYRNTHSSFRDYVQSVYGLNVRSAYELVEHSEIVEQVKNECANFAQLATPSQTRPLKKVPVDKRAEVIEAATQKAGGHPTAKAITAAVKEVCPDPEPEPEPQRNDKKLLAALGGKLPALPNREQELAKHLETFRNDLTAMCRAIPQDAHLPAYMKLLQGESALLFNKERNAKLTGAYTR